ncbi:MAG: hypothetical protein ACKOJF_23025, partial [Planctomycetaceae bacterium]
AKPVATIHGLHTPRQFISLAREDQPAPAKLVTPRDAFPRLGLEVKIARQGALHTGRGRVAPQTLCLMQD